MQEQAVYVVTREKSDWDVEEIKGERGQGQSLDQWSCNSFNELTPRE